MLFSLDLPVVEGLHLALEAFPVAVVQEVAKVGRDREETADNGYGLHRTPCLQFDLADDGRELDTDLA